MQVAGLANDRFRHQGFCKWNEISTDDLKEQRCVFYGKATSETRTDETRGAKLGDKSHDAR